MIFAVNVNYCVFYCSGSGGTTIINRNTLIKVLRFLLYSNFSYSIFPPEDQVNEDVF